MKYAIWGLFITLFCTTCTNDDEFSDNSTNQVLVFYLGGNNNLSDEISDKIKSIQDGSINKGIFNKIIILYSTQREYPTLAEIIFEKDKSTMKKIKNYPSADMSDPSFFYDFLTEIRKLYPANQYGLVLFSHSSGWMPQSTFANPRIDSRSILVDDGNEMELTDFANAIPPKMFDFIIFESCLMSGIEVAYELRNKTNYIVASSTEIISPGFTPIYSISLQHLLKNTPDLISFAKDYFNYCNSLDGLFKSATISVIDTRHLESLAMFISTIDNKEGGYIHTIQHFDRYYKNLYFDFQDYYSQFLDENNRETLHNYVKASVIYKANTEYFVKEKIDKHSGLTTYILQDQYPYLNRKYKELDWYKAIKADTYSIGYR